MKALLQRHKKKKEEKDKKKKGVVSSPSSADASEEVTRMASRSKSPYLVFVVALDLVVCPIYRC